MKTFFGLLGEALPTSGTHLSLLAFELPPAITPTVAGLAVGAFVGVFGFIAVLLIVGRGGRRGTERRGRMPADRLVVIPPYGTMPRDTPLPPAAFQASSGRLAPPYAEPPYAAYAEPPYAEEAYARQSHTQPFTQAQVQHAPPPHRPPLAFVPSTNLSARAFAKMGYAVDDDELDSPHADPEVLVEVDFLDVDEDEVAAKTYAPPPAPVSIAKVVMVEESGALRAGDKSDPHPLGIIKSGSPAMLARPASFADLEMDDGATEIGETYFDEPPQPRRRTDPPKIRAIAPSGPRFPASLELPPPTPPPTRVATSAARVARPARLGG